MKRIKFKFLFLQHKNHNFIPFSEYEKSMKSIPQQKQVVNHCITKIKKLGSPDIHCIEQDLEIRFWN